LDAPHCSRPAVTGRAIRFASIFGSGETHVSSPGGGNSGNIRAVNFPRVRAAIPVQARHRVGAACIGASVEGISFYHYLSFLFCRRTDLSCPTLIATADEQFDFFCRRPDPRRSAAGSSLIFVMRLQPGK
jgi:hypothetical protein